MDKRGYECSECGNFLSTAQTLARHKTPTCPSKRPKVEKAPKTFQCVSCLKNCSTKQNLQQHEKTCVTAAQSKLRSSASSTPPDDGGITASPLSCDASITAAYACGICGVRVGRIADLAGHVSDAHDENAIVEQVEFNSADEFNSWRSALQEETSAEFSKACSKKSTQGTTYHYYRCSRSGASRAKSADDRLRTVSERSCKKIGFDCTAFITAKESNGVFSVSYCSDHYGNDTDGMGFIHQRMPQACTTFVTRLLTEQPDLTGQQVLARVKAAFPDKNSRSYWCTSKDISNIMQRRGFLPWLKDDDELASYEAHLADYERASWNPIIPIIHIGASNTESSTFADVSSKTDSRNSAVLKEQQRRVTDLTNSFSAKLKSLVDSADVVKLQEAAVILNKAIQDVDGLGCRRSSLPPVTDSEPSSTMRKFQKQLPFGQSRALLPPSKSDIDNNCGNCGRHVAKNKAITCISCSRMTHRECSKAIHGEMLCSSDTRDTQFICLRCNNNPLFH